MGYDSQIPVAGMSSVKIQHGEFKNVLYVPSLTANLLFVYRMTHTGTPKRVTFNSELVEIIEKSTGNLIVKGFANHASKDYEFSCFLLVSHPTTILTHANNTGKICHEIFEHLHFKYLQKLHNDKMVERFPLIEKSDGVCPGCLVGKSPKKRYEVGKATRATSTLDLIHNNVLGPMPTKSINGSMYFLTFIDDCSRFCWVYFMKQKSEVFETFKVFKALVENRFGKKIKSITLDNGGE